MTRLEEYKLRLKFWLSKRLCPEVHRDADRFDRLVGQVLIYEQWLSTTHPEAAALCHQLLKEDLHYWTGEHYATHESCWWRAPKYVWGVQAFRDWLDRRPFKDRSTS